MLAKQRRESEHPDRSNAAAAMKAADNTGVLGHVHNLVKTEHKILGSGDERNEAEWADTGWTGLERQCLVQQEAWLGFHLQGVRGKEEESYTGSRSERDALRLAFSVEEP